MSRVTVGIVGAAGQTGSSIVNALLEDNTFQIIALARPSSLSKPANLALQKRGVELRPLDLTASQDSIVSSLSGVDVLISAMSATEQLAQLSLVTAAKVAGVKRFLPCAFMPVVPAGGIHMLRDDKEVIFNHIKKIRLPYTIVDVGWWYQISVPRVPGKTDYIVFFNGEEIAGTGDIPSGLTDLRDIGRYVARIIVDDRTLNKYVFAYSELWTENQIYDLYARKTGDEIPRKHVGEEELQQRIANAGDGRDRQTLMQVIESQYMISWGIRGDNQPEYAKYLGYLTSKELYPDLKYRSFEEYTEEVLSGKATGVYEEMQSLSELRKASAKAS